MLAKAAIDKSCRYLQASQRKLDFQALTKHIGKRTCGELAPLRVEQPHPLEMPREN
jgi:hypothetical protein